MGAPPESEIRDTPVDADFVPSGKEQYLAVLTEILILKTEPGDVRC
jgi:hypothetical protein